MWVYQFRFVSISYPVCFCYSYLCYTKLNVGASSPRAPAFRVVAFLLAPTLVFVLIKLAPRPYSFFRLTLSARNQMSGPRIPAALASTQWFVRVQISRILCFSKTCSPTAPNFFCYQFVGASYPHVRGFREVNLFIYKLQEFPVFLKLVPSIPGILLSILYKTKCLGSYPRAPGFREIVCPCIDVGIFLFGSAFLRSHKVRFFCFPFSTK